MSEPLQVRVEQLPQAMDAVAIAIGPRRIISDDAQDFIVAMLDWKPFEGHPNTPELRATIAHTLNGIVNGLISRGTLEWHPFTRRWRIIL